MTFFTNGMQLRAAAIALRIMSSKLRDSRTLPCRCNTSTPLARNAETTTLNWMRIWWSYGSPSWARTNYSCRVKPVGLRSFIFAT